MPNEEASFPDIDHFDFDTTYGRRIEASPTKSYYIEEFGRLFTRRARVLADVASESEQEFGLGERGECVRLQRSM
jgi:hypothetical protein